MDLGKQIYILILFGVISLTYCNEVKAQNATSNINIMVGGAITVSNNADTMLNPTNNVNRTITPAVGLTDFTNTLSFKVRTNYSNWTLSAQRTGFNPGTTGILPENIGFRILKNAGAAGNVNACAFQGVFTGVTDLSAISDVSSTPICAGTSKTSMSVSSSANTNNFLRFRAQYIIPRDFFFEPGMASDTIIYTVTNP